MTLTLFFQVLEQRVKYGIFYGTQPFKNMHILKVHLL